MLNKYKNIEFAVILPSCRPNFVRQIKESLPNLSIIHVDGTGFASTAKLVNLSIMTAKKAGAEYMVMLMDKMRPKEHEFYEMFDLLEKGYSQVHFWPFAFYCMHLDAIRQGGFHEERLMGQWDDSDKIRTLKERDMAMVMLHKTFRLNIPTIWGNLSESERLFRQKWGGPSEMTRLLPELEYDYDIGSHTGKKFLPWKQSIVDVHEPKTEERLDAYLRALGLKE